MTTTKEKIEIMQAWIDGKTIQILEDKWVDYKPNTEPAWNWDQFQYRIKPEPKVIWVNEYMHTNVVYFSEESAKAHAPSDAIRVAVKYQEVIE